MKKLMIVGALAAIAVGCTEESNISGTDVSSSPVMDFLTMEGTPIRDVTNELMSAMSPVGSARLLPNANILQVWDRPENIRKMKDLAKALDKPSGDVVTNAHVLTHAKPSEMKRALDALVRPSYDIAHAPAEFIADENSNAVIVISRKKPWPKVTADGVSAAVIGCLDVEDDDSAKPVENVRVLRRAKVDDAVATVNAMFGDGVAHASPMISNAVAVMAPRRLWPEIEDVLDCVDVKSGNLLFVVEVLRVANVRSVDEAREAIRANSAAVRVVEDFAAGGPEGNGSGCVGSRQVVLKSTTPASTLSIDLCAHWVDWSESTVRYVLAWSTVRGAEVLSGTADAFLRRPVILGGFMAAEGTESSGKNVDTAYVLRVTVRDLGIEDSEKAAKERAAAEKAYDERKRQEVDESQKELNELAEKIRQEIQRKKLEEENKKLQQKGGVK